MKRINIIGSIAGNFALYESYIDLKMKSVGYQKEAEHTSLIFMAFWFSLMMLSLVAFHREGELPNAFFIQAAGFFYYLVDYTKIVDSSGAFNKFIRMFDRNIYHAKEQMLRQAGNIEIVVQASLDFAQKYENP